MKYIIIKAFPGSPDGMVAVNFNEGDVVDCAELGDDLIEVALAEKWIEEKKEKQEITEMESDRLTDLLEVIGTLDQNNKAHWKNNGSPEIDAIKEISGGKISGAERDYVWCIYQTSEYPVDDESRLESLVAAIEVLDADNAGDFIESSGKPSIVSLSVITDGPVSGVERDVAWIEFSKEDLTE